MPGGALLVNNLKEIGTYLGEGDGCDAFDEQHYAAAALALYLDKDAFGAVEHSAMDAYPGASFDVDLLGAQVGDVGIGGVGDVNELLHLTLWDGDWNVFTALRACAVLQEIDALLEGFDSLLCGVHED